MFLVGFAPDLRLKVILGPAQVIVQVVNPALEVTDFTFKLLMFVIRHVVHPLSILNYDTDIPWSCTLYNRLRHFGTVLDKWLLAAILLANLVGLYGATGDIIADALYTGCYLTNRF